MKNLLATLSLMTLFFGGAARAEPVRLLFAIGANLGDPEDPPLRYADDDAERVRRAFVELGGVTSDRAYVVTDQTVTTVRERLAELGGRIAELRASGQEVVLVIYASGHARAGELHLRGGHLPLAELRTFAEKSGARLRLLVIDACDSGIVARKKGGRAGPEYEVSLERLPLRGEVVITSSGPAEASEEWESLEGSLFTHHLLTGLRGDADVDGDGRVTLNEGYAYAWRRTLASSARGGQHPAFDLDLTGSGEVVLTEPSKAGSAIVFPAKLSGAYLVSSQPQASVVAEVEKIPGRPLRLAVPPGRYLVRKRAGSSTGLLQLELPFGGVRQVDDDALEWRDYAEVALKGGVVELRPWLASLEGGAGSPTIPGTGARFAGTVGLSRGFGDFWAEARASGGRSSYLGRALTIHEQAGALTLSGGWRFLSLPVTPRVGLAAQSLLVRQTFERDREAEIAPVFGSIKPRYTLGFAMGPEAGVLIPLGSRVSVVARADMFLLQLPTDAAATLRPVVQLGLGLGFRF